MRQMIFVGLIMVAGIYGCKEKEMDGFVSEVKLSTGEVFFQDVSMDFEDRILRAENKVFSNVGRYIWRIRYGVVDEKDRGYMVRVGFDRILYGTVVNGQYIEIDTARTRYNGTNEILKGIITVLSNLVSGDAVIEISKEGKISEMSEMVQLIRKSIGGAKWIWGDIPAEQMYEAVIRSIVENYLFVIVRDKGKQEVERNFVQVLGRDIKGQEMLRLTDSRDEFGFREGTVHGRIRGLGLDIELLGAKKIEVNQVSGKVTGRFLYHATGVVVSSEREYSLKAHLFVKDAISGKKEQQGVYNGYLRIRTAVMAEKR